MIRRYWYWLTGRINCPCPHDHGVTPGRCKRCTLCREQVTRPEAVDRG